MGWASPHPACQRPNSKLCWKIGELGKDHFADFDYKRDQPKIVFFDQKVCHGLGVFHPFFTDRIRKSSLLYVPIRIEEYIATYVFF